MRKRDRSRRRLYATALCAVFCLLLWLLHASVVHTLSVWTVQAAKSYLPLPAFTTTHRAGTEPSASAPQTRTTKEAETTHVQTTTKEKKSEKAKTGDLTETPQDILDLIAAAEKSAKNDKKDGAIAERTFQNEGMTDRSGVVRVKNTNETKINVEKLLQKKADLSVTKDKPSVLIFHTHTTESYQYLDRNFYAAGFPTRSTDPQKNMVRVGDAICSELENAGFQVLHDTQIHDARYNGAYERSRATVKEYQKQYPSLQVLLDIHRDAIQQTDGTKLKPVATVNGKKAAQVMIISGCQEEGNGVTDFPDWEQNLVFALQLQQKMEESFPGLTRPLFFSPRRYNMHLSHCSLLIEVGSDSNTLEEAEYSGRLIGASLAKLLEEYRKEKS